jgi:hypothetical protein
MDYREIFSEKIPAGSRTFFIDIQRTSKGDLTLKISEKRKVDGDTERHRVMIFQEDVEKFAEAMNRAVAKFREIQNG